MLSRPDTLVRIIDDNVGVCHSLEFLFDSFYELDVRIYHNPLLFLNDFSPAWQGCLIIDLFMPTLNGIDLMKELMRRNCKMHIIIMSAHHTPSLASQCIQAGAYAFISKPFKLDAFLTCMSSILDVVV